MFNRKSPCYEWLELNFAFLYCESPKDLAMLFLCFFTEVVLWVYEGFQRNEGIHKVPLFAMLCVVSKH